MNIKSLFLLFFLIPIAYAEESTQADILVKEVIEQQPQQKKGPATETSKQAKQVEEDDFQDDDAGSFSDFFTRLSQSIEEMGRAFDAAIHNKKFENGMKRVLEKTTTFAQNSFSHNAASLAINDLNSEIAIVVKFAQEPISDPCTFDLTRTDDTFEIHFPSEKNDGQKVSLEGAVIDGHLLQVNLTQEETRNNNNQTFHSSSLAHTIFGGLSLKKARASYDTHNKEFKLFIPKQQNTTKKNISIPVEVK